MANKASENMQVLTYYSADVSAGVQLPADGAWFDIEDYEYGMCIAHLNTAASNLTTFRLLSNTLAAGTGTDNVVKTLTNPTNIDAAGETALLEWKSSEITDGDHFLTADINSAGAVPVTLVFINCRPRYANAGETTATETAST